MVGALQFLEKKNKDGIQQIAFYLAYLGMNDIAQGRLTHSQHARQRLFRLPHPRLLLC